MESKNDTEKGTPTPGDTFNDLRGRQSVRATFKLSSICIDAISIVAGQLGIKQKSLFDHLFQDSETLGTIAEEVKNKRLEAANRTQKTFVMSRNTLLCLEEVSKNFNAPRDAIIETAVQRLMPIIAKEQVRHVERKTVVKKIGSHLESGRRLLEEAYAKLGEDDPLTERLAAAISSYESAFRQMAAYIEKTKDIEAFETEAVEEG